MAHASSKADASATVQHAIPQTRIGQKTSFQSHADTMTQVALTVSGGISGAFAKTVTAPFGRLTILYQVRRHFALFCHACILRLMDLQHLTKFQD